MAYQVGFTDSSNTKVRITIYGAENEMDAKYQVAKSDDVKEFRYCVPAQSTTDKCRGT